MNSEQLIMAEDSDSGSEATVNSTSESNFDESFGADIEVAKIMDQKFHLPKDLCEHSEIFREFFSFHTWNSLTSDEQSMLLDFLPQFPENSTQEREETINKLFTNTLERFNQTPFSVFQNNLQDGNYRPDIAYYRKSILKSEEREQRIRECERISELSERLVCSREKLLRSSYRCPVGSFTQLFQTSASIPRLSSSSASMRANRRYFQKILKLSKEFGISLSDDETVPDGMNIQLTKKQIKLLTEPESLGPEMRIVGTTSTKEKNWDHLTSLTITDERYKQMLQSYKKRKIIEPDHPEMEINDIKLKDVFNRTQLTINPKKVNSFNVRKSLMIDPNRLKQETGNYEKLQTLKNPKKVITTDQTAIKSETTSETDEEDWIKANILKVEPQSKGGRLTKIKTIYPQYSANITVNRKRTNIEPVRASSGNKKIIIDAGGTMKSSFVNKTNPKRIVINSRPTISIDPNDLIENDGDDIESPELRHEVQACFLSLIRDIFCSTRDHRMKLEELRNRINIWMSNPIASANEWFMEAGGDWGSLLISAVHFLSGEFQDQPEDFVPYLEFKSQLNIYQWIGASRDSDTRMVPLCQYWLSRRNDMGVKLKSYKTLVKTFTSPEKNEENHLQQAISPPNIRCQTDWKVQPATFDEIREFRLQEKLRYENPHQPFTYRQHGYESVVGPLRGIYSQSPAVSKARDHNTLIADRPNFVTILALVRDATARLPNGEGTRCDICELLKSSQYIIPGTSDVVIQSIVSSALDRIHAEPDPCIKYDTKRKLWVYVHRNRSESDFERLHQQQNINRQKKPVFRKTKLLDQHQMNTVASPIRVISSPNSNVRTYTKFSSMSTSKAVSTSSPQPLKMSPRKVAKTVENERNVEQIDVEASLDAQAIVKNADAKRITFKHVQPMSPVRILTSSPNYVQTATGIQSNVATKKLAGKPVVINQSQVPPLVSQSSTNCGQSYLIPINVKQCSQPPALSVPKTSVPPQKNFIKINPSGKNLINPQQKIILTSAAAKGGKVMTLPKTQTPVTMLSQQKQILTNVIVQQQKAKGQSQIIMNAQHQKMPGLTISNSSQVIQIQQTSADGKTISSANLTPQQKQTIFQSLKQFKQGSNQHTMIVKSGIKSANEVSTPPLVSTNGNIGKIIKTGTIQQPQIMVSIGQKTETHSPPIVARVAGNRQLDNIVPKVGTTFKIAGQPNLIQISGSSQVAQYTVVSKGKNIITMGNQTKLLTTQANTQVSSSQGLVASTGNIMVSNNQTQPNIQTSQPIKIVQSGSITAQQLVGAKLINVQTLANKGVKSSGIKMINPQHYQLANIGGKSSLIIANKGNVPTSNNTNSSQGLVLQASNSSSGTFILNSSGQQLKVGNVLTQPVTSQPQSIMLGNQIVKVHSLNQMQQKINNPINSSEASSSPGDGQRPIILGSTIKLMKPQQQRVVLATPSGSQFTQQIILPANFQNLKSIQGLKVIQQGTSDRVFSARNLSMNSSSPTNNKSATSSEPQETDK